MGKITFEKTNGGIYTPPSGKDHVSGLLVYDTEAMMDYWSNTVPFGTKITSVEQYVELLEAGGVFNLGSQPPYGVVMYHQISELFRINPSAEVYVGAAPMTDDEGTSIALDFSEVKKLQRAANGAIRQMGVLNVGNDLAAAEVGALQAVATALEAEEMPLSILYAANVETAAALPDLQSGGRSNVSVVIGQDIALATSTAYSAALDLSLPCLGAVLGALSSAQVHQSIGWVQQFPMGIDTPGLCDGSLISEVDPGVLFGSGSLEEKGYIFLRKYTGMSGSYLNDSRTLDLATSDYSHIERVRTMDKALRGIRHNLTPHINGNLRIDAESGEMAADAVAFLETVANRALEDMEKAGELSGYKVLIDSAQNVLGTGVVKFVIQNVPMAVVREYSIKIGFTSNI